MMPALILLALSGCASGASVTDTFCEVYRPVCLSRADTEETIRQVLGNEAAFETLCLGEAERVECR